MAKQKTGTRPDEFLRARATKFLARPEAELDKIPPTEIQKLVHELQIHQVELDIQNEELRRAQGEAEAAGVKYADLFDFAPIGYFIFNRQGVILDANLTGARLLGVERGSLLRTPFSFQVLPACQPEFIAHLQRVFTTRARQSCTLQLATQAGPVLQVAMESMAVEGPASGPTQCRSAFIDITARKQAEEEINTTVAFLENTIASSVDPIAIVDDHGRFTRWNQAAAEAYGYSAEGLAGQTAFDLYADKNALEKMLRQLRRDGFVRGYEIDMRKKDGTIAPFSLSIGLFGDEAGKSIGSVCVARDLSETRKSMAELSLINAKLQGLVEEADKRNRELTFINSMAEKLQSCLSLDEAYPLIAQHVQGLFPARSGALFIQDPSTNLMEAVSTWGDAVAGEPVFPLTDCWALRRGRVNVGGRPRREMRCRHMPPQYPGNYLCLPLLAQGETLGMLLVLDLADLIGELAEPLQTLAVTVGDHISLALANIRLRETLRHQVVHDALTGLFNRRYLEETLEREIYRGRRKGASLGLIMLDLDRFKHFNDTYGHDAGDNLLRTLGKFLG